MRKKKYESVNLLKAFLKQKYAAEHNGKCKKIEVHIADIPQQTNASDCGLFAIRSANLFLRSDAQHYYNALKDPSNSEAEINEYYNRSPVPTRKTVLRSIRTLTNNH
ncbi:hypothetical protein MFLAVUS_011078 [Mucor flavus]|uniref:Ubiquitin-like protease family profile domain-containing protein n=1 Tax=Mucor flavus TaxID=439312 RepID=A0ABP9ZEI5_9FUNG